MALLATAMSDVIDGGFATEDREFAHKMLTAISATVSVDIMSIIPAATGASWNAFQAKMEQAVIVRAKHPRICKICLECGCQLQLEYDATTSDSLGGWYIIECEQCRSIDMLAVPAGVNRYYMHGFD